ncbi:hypothetical protein GCM10010430_61380 [Kitasatospora cystarginea]|uniref:Uncharacterized protein n=1 Tax=Kitasatospora cystarginea TaxID=58350 RepID=A0ABN3ERM3_9ACTN
MCAPAANRVGTVACLISGVRPAWTGPDRSGVLTEPVVPEPALQRPPSSCTGSNRGGRQHIDPSTTCKAESQIPVMLFVEPGLAGPQTGIERGSAGIPSPGPGREAPHKGPAAGEPRGDFGG